MDYQTINSNFSAETEEKKSRFIATLVPYSLFEGTLECLRAEHRKASHHVTAFRRMDENDRVVELGKDDGEPSGTSGMPVLKTLIGANLMDVAVIVTRYFGGTKLGTGGLARAYSGSSNAVIEVARFQTWQQIVKFEATASFERASEIETIIRKTTVTVNDRLYETDGVRFMLEGPKELVSMFKLDEYPN